MKKNDGYLAAAIAVAALLLWMARQFPEKGGWITVTQGGEIVGVYSLTEDAAFTFSDENGDGGRNVLTVRDGEAYMSEADCPDKLCMRQKAISGRGESIVCLPHRLVVEVTSGGDGGTDAVAR